MTDTFSHQNRIVPPPAKGTLINKRIVRAEKGQEGCRIVISKNVVKQQLYTYKAVVEHVVDGHTLRANIDCGFGLWSRQYLRLKWVDAPKEKIEEFIKSSPVYDTLTRPVQTRVEVEKVQ